MRKNWHPSRREFESLVEESLEDLPQKFRDLLENIVVIVEDDPSDEDLDDQGLDEDDELLGIFRGVPRTQASIEAPYELPNQIAIFMQPILRMARDAEDAAQQIRETVIHELGHYFGLEDDEMEY